ncbi:signal recognition particle-docking protein FtsY [Legionella jamestowniensis]|uniref:Signal recognition particle receptor FtsY n=1 Tax=Legionella jamestowniensis TaxID=455 RepID=A0A0W0UYS3_9GAMM|nr:signal recognition particle-docking protein FtsY [Legionella jamestowniensis]KTD12983.1 cell division membrane protein FtsY [Legionella jamestowniensis]OCH98232.1 signal recognition particle-docking protein FtsY [Legionella jamestowniensis]SFL79036.1 signal recognition particle-docking protein FtsY [Legionella jamestowniensis DSM 19215]
MIKWFKRNQEEAAPVSKASEEISLPVEEREQADSQTAIPSTKEGFFARFKKGLSKTRQQFGDSVGRLLLGKKEIDTSILEDLETLLLSADLGIETSQLILKQLIDALARKQLTDGNAVFQALKQRLEEILLPCEKPLNLETPDKSPFVILTVGVNGAGKTTSIGKMAKQFQQQGKKVMLAAGDTFRAAAVEQLQVWGERNQIPVIAQHTGADSASVIYDALQAARARGIDILIADTAGRLHTQSNLMEELKKVKRVMQKLDPHAPHEVLLVLDAGIGQNALNQARQFHEAVGLTGIMMTKLDGTAKGGILFAIASELGIPFRYLGMGEGIDDLRPFNASQFVRAIFNDDQI